MIYLFCSEGYGAPFIETARQVARDHRFPLTLVLSLRGAPAGGEGFLRRARQRLGRSRLTRSLERRHGLPVRLAEDVNADSFRDAIPPRSHGVVAGFNQIFKQQTIDRFATLVNFHPSLLPYYRGPIPSTWCLRNGEESSGFTLHRVTRRIDDGEILYQQQVATAGCAAPDELDLRIAEAGAPLLRRWLSHVDGGAEFPTVTLDAAAIYRHHPGYLSFEEATEA